MTELDENELYANRESDVSKTDAMNTLRKAMSRLNEGDRSSTFDVSVQLAERPADAERDGGD